MALLFALIFGNTTAEREKHDKRLANRVWRAAVRRAVTQGLETMPHRHEHSDPWSMAKDGKRWMAECVRRTPRPMNK